MLIINANVGRDNENDLENLVGDSDTEFIPCDWEKLEKPSLHRTIILRLRTLPVPRETYMKNLEAVVQDTIAELSPVSSPTSSRISSRMNKSIRKIKLLHEHDLTDRNMVMPTPKPEAEKRKMQLKRLQSPSTPSAVNNHEVHNKNNSCH